MQQETFQSVPPALSQELIKIIRLLAMTGRTLFRRYLKEPLDESGWTRAGRHLESSGTMMERLEKAARTPNTVHTTGLLARKLISRAMQETDSTLGNAVIFYLTLMLENIRVSSTEEANELVKIIESPLRKFQELQNERSEKIFADTLSSFSEEEIRTAFQPVKLSDAGERVKLDEEIARLYSQILHASKAEDFVRCRRYISQYMIRFSDQKNYNEEELEKIIEALEKRQKGFSTSLYNFIAIELYYSITRNISKGKIPPTVQAIRKYAHIFQGNPESMYFYEIDKMERILYKLISERKLWKELDKQV